MAKEFSYEIIKKVGTIGEKNSYSKEVNYIKFNSKEPVLDIRNWYNNGEEKQMLKGISLTNSEALELRNLLNTLELE
jgi:hypothetical protein